ncbi:AAA family ATPase [Hydrogenimonas sp. SS33]|uniref:SF1B family DNA helicase RecD2 n=1 Tax=Hydrogenimonas leucolamina TaxID=2954236 RepID=UPI00336BC5AB
MKLTGRIDKILFQKEGFLIAVLDNGAKVSGSCLITDIDALEKQEVELEGEWQEHPRFGPQFVFESLEIKGSELYFYLTKVVKGVGQKLVKRLIAHYGEEELLRILDEEPQKLLAFKGIKEKKLAQITESWQRYKEIRQLAMFLAPYKIGQSIVSEIYQTFIGKENLIEAIKANPYIITQVKGVGFKRADEMARSMGIDPRSPFRIEAAVGYVMKEIAEQQGSSAVSRKRLMAALHDLLEMEGEEALVGGVIDQMVEKETLVRLEEGGESWFAHRFYYRAEEGLYRFFKARKEKRMPPPAEDMDAFIADMQKQMGISLGEEQKAAVQTLGAGATAMALVGYAGTGKSTVAKTMLELLKRRYGEEAIMTTALSGIAAQRIHDTTGFQSATIQSLLVTHKEKEELPYDVVLLDEASMVNSQIFFQLVSMLREDAVFIIVGDDGQLPPIGAGNILADIVQYELLPVVKLTRIYRQSDEQAITLIADSIRQARVPELSDRYIDFRFVDRSIPDFYAKKATMNEEERRKLREEHNRTILESIKEEAVPTIVEARELLKEKRIGDYLTKIQVITPMRSGLLGVENLNIELQKLFNPSPKHGVKKGPFTYGLYDKVVHIKNENMPAYTPEGFKEGEEAVTQRIYNGMIGLIFKMDPEEEECFVYYPTEGVVVRYGYEHLGEYLTLAYALTIHKTQGMEYDTVIIPMTFSHYIMHNTKLLYTAVTRAKKMCIVVGEAAAFKSACRRIDTTKRTTVLGLLAKAEV